MYIRVDNAKEATGGFNSCILLAKDKVKTEVDARCRAGHAAIACANDKHIRFQGVDDVGVVDLRRLANPISVLWFFRDARFRESCARLRRATDQCGSGRKGRQGA